MKMLRFGGPNLTAGQKTFYFALNENGDVAQVFVRYGAVVPEDQVQRHEADGSLSPNADYYVTSGMAEYVDSAAIPDTAEDPFGK